MGTLSLMKNKNKLFVLPVSLNLLVMVGPVKRENRKKKKRGKGVVPQMQPIREQD